MAKEGLKAGDKVRHKTGGPEMIVDYFDLGTVYCSYWNTKKNAKEQAQCSEDSLEKVGPAMGAPADTLARRLEALEARVQALELTK